MTLLSGNMQQRSSH